MNFRFPLVVRNPSPAPPLPPLMSPRRPRDRRGCPEPTPALSPPPGARPGLSAPPRPGRARRATTLAAAPGNGASDSPGGAGTGEGTGPRDPERRRRASRTVPSRASRVAPALPAAPNPARQRLADRGVAESTTGYFSRSVWIFGPLVRFKPRIGTRYTVLMPAEATVAAILDAVRAQLGGAPTPGELREASFMDMGLDSLDMVAVVKCANTPGGPPLGPARPLTAAPTRRERGPSRRR